MAVIAQRELRNQVSRVLRRAEQGERFTVTVDGRPVAELGPLSGPRRPAPPERLAAVIGESPVDSGWITELRAMRDVDAVNNRDIWAN